MNEFEQAFEEMKQIIRNNETQLSPELIATCQEALRLCKEETCNGWSNHETWLFNLWMMNDESYYRYLWDSIDGVMDQEYPINVMAGIMENLFDQAEEYFDIKPGIISDLLSSAKYRINFYEIAKNFLEE